MSTDAALSRQAAGPDAQFDWAGHSGPLHLKLYKSPAHPVTCGSLLVFFHPGGFVVDDLEEANHCLRVVADACEVHVLAPSYALAPERPFPAAVEDAHAVLVQVSKHKRQLGWKGTHLFVGGVEAGGNLAAVSALVSRDRLGPALAGQILVMPMLDASQGCQSMRCAEEVQDGREMARTLAESYRRYLPRPADRLHPYASPLKARRLGELPPALIFHTEGDPLADEAMAYADKLRHAGNQAADIALPPTDIKDNQDRCDLTADDPCILAMKRFMAERSEPRGTKTTTAAAKSATPTSVTSSDSDSDQGAQP